MPDLPEITDAEMQTILEYAQPYTVSILRSGPNFGSPEAGQFIKEHGRRTLALRKAGELAVVLPIRGNADIHGVGVFDRDADGLTLIELVDGVTLEQITAATDAPFRVADHLK